MVRPLKAIVEELDGAAADGDRIPEGIGAFKSAVLDCCRNSGRFRMNAKTEIVSRAGVVMEILQCYIVHIQRGACFYIHYGKYTVIRRICPVFVAAVFQGEVCQRQDISRSLHFDENHLVCIIRKAGTAHRNIIAPHDSIVHTLTCKDRSAVPVDGQASRNRSTGIGIFRSAGQVYDGYIGIGHIVGQRLRGDCRDFGPHLRRKTPCGFAGDALVNATASGRCEGSGVNQDIIAGAVVQVCGRIDRDLSACHRDLGAVRRYRLRNTVIGGLFDKDVFAGYGTYIFGECQCEAVSRVNCR